MAETSTPTSPSLPATGDLGTVFNPPARGFLDRLIRRFGVAAHVIVTLAVYAIAAIAIGFALAPALAFLSSWLTLWAGSAGSSWWIAVGVGLGVAFFLAGFSLLIVVPVFNWVLPTRVKPFHGGYYSIAAVPWLLHNAMFYLVRFTFLPFVTLTPFGLLFLGAMGMRIGRRAFINTELISDPRLITIGDDVVIGGSVHLFAHYGGGGHLTIAPIRIGDRATIGQKATVMGGATVGNDAVILPHSVLLPGSRVGAGEVWGGVPARPIGDEELERFKQRIHGVSAPLPRAE
jgi:acetyltransferase-like isoleucine patch superfamily enzyme